MRISDWSSDVCSSDLTGLGAAQLLRVDGHHHVIETESGHIGFAPLDEVETRIRERLGERYGRVSVERIVSGPALDDIYAALGGTPPAEDRALWTAALEGTDPLAMEALERFCLSLGSVAGDLLRAVAGRDRKSTRLNSSH